METLSRMLTEADLIEAVYTDHLPYNGLWERISRTPGAPRPDPKSTRPGDTLTAERHLGIARGKATNPPRIAVVGGINVGKSTFLNALLHHKEVDRIFRTQFGYTGRLLKTGDDVTTGNITEIAFTGEDLAPTDDDPRSEGSRFTFAVKYLSEDDLSGLFQFFAGKLKLALPEAAFTAPGWRGRLKEVLPALAKKYGTAGTELKDNRNLRVMWELIESVSRPDLAPLLGNEVELGSGQAGFDKFRALMERPKLEVQGTWEANREKLYVGPFHLVKCLRARIPHPEFRLPFSLHDFPGLGSGMHRDEYLSREFIAEANLILLVFRPGMIGGEAVEHIIETFAERRRGMTAQELLKRMYFVHQGVPNNLPKDGTLTEFYLSFLKAVKNLTGSVLDRKNVTPQKTRELLQSTLTHYMAFDARLADFLIHTDDDSQTAKLAREEYAGRVNAGAYICPTDLPALRALSRDPKLTDATTGYPLLAEMLSDARVGQSIREVLEPLQTAAGLDHMLARLKRFVAEDAPRLQAEDVREHLRAAAAPLAAVDRLVAGTAADGTAGDPYDPAQVRPLFDAASDFEARWQRALEVRRGGDRTPQDRAEWSVRVNGRLEDAQLAVEEKIREMVDRVVRAEAFGKYKGSLTAPPEGFRNWLMALQDTDEGGDDWFPATAESDLWLNHTLQLYRYFLSARAALFAEFYATVFPQYAEDVIGAYLESGAREFWTPFSDVWNRVVREAGSGTTDLDEEFRTRAGAPPFAEFFRSVPDTTRSPGWLPRKQIATMFPPGGAADSRGQFFEKYGRPGKRRVRIGTWRADEKLPATGAQLAAWFARMRLPIGGVDLNRRRVEPLPDLSPAQVLRALKAVGVLDASVTAEQVAFAGPKDDFWQAPLPQLTGRRVIDGTIVWNSAPFDPYAGSLDQLSRNLSPNAIPLWLDLIRTYLADMFRDLAEAASRQWLEDYSNRWQSKLTKSLAVFSEKDNPLWRWLGANGARLSGDDPLANKIKVLTETLAALRAAGLLADAP